MGRVGELRTRWAGSGLGWAELGSGRCAQSLSNTTALNPLMAGWTKVLVQYCDGASWAGLNRSMTTYVDPESGQATELHFAGKANLDGLITSLKADSSLEFASAKDVVVSGGSAGGLATYLHTDTFRAALPDTRVVGMPDAGFFMSNDVSIASGWQAGVVWAAQAQNTSAGVPPACLAHYEPLGEGWK